jgi:hypothetical protein
MVAVVFLLCLCALKNLARGGNRSFTSPGVHWGEWVARAAQQRRAQGADGGGAVTKIRLAVRGAGLGMMHRDEKNDFLV